MMRPRCGKPVRYTQLRPGRRTREDPFPACGRPAGHSELGGCMSEEAYARSLEQKRIAKAYRRARAREAAA